MPTAMAWDNNIKANFPPKFISYLCIIWNTKFGFIYSFHPISPGTTAFLLKTEVIHCVSLRKRIALKKMDSPNKKITI